MANNIVLNPQRGDTIALTAVASAYRQPSAFQPIGQTVYSTASITANANNALVGKAITISGFAAAGNNGTFAVLASTATSITVNNAFGVVVGSGGTAVFQTTGTPAQYASKIENIWSNQNGDNVTVNANAGDTLIAVVVGMKSYAPFDLLHGTAPYFPQFGNNAGNSGDYPNGGFNFGQLQGLNDFNANPSVSDLSGGAAVDISASSLASGTLSITYVNDSQPGVPGATPPPYFIAGESVKLSGMKEAWLNGSSVTVAASPAPTAYTFAATAGFTAPVLQLTESEGAFALPGGEVVTTYLGTITNGANDAYAGTTFTVANFTNSGNNGSFVVLNSTATTLTLINAHGVAETHSGVAASLAITEGSSVLHVTAAGTGTAYNSVTVAIDDTTTGAPTVSGNAITLHTDTYTVATYVAAFPAVTVTAGTVNLSFTGAGTDSFTTASAAPLAGGINAATATAIAFTNADDTGSAQPAGNVWSLAANANIIDADYTVTYPFSGPTYTAGPQTPQRLVVTHNGVSTTILYVPQPQPEVTVPYQSSKWNNETYYPSIYVFVASDVVAGSYKINLNSMYQPGDANNNIDWSQGGVPIFDGGANFQVFNVSGAATIGQPEVVSITTTETTANPATAPATLALTGGDGGMILSVGLLKNGNVFQAGSTGLAATPLALTAVSPLNYGPPQFAKNNFGGAVYTGTITGGANNALAGTIFTVTGFTNALNNGTFTATASTATTLTLTNGSAIAQTGATASAAYSPSMTVIGSGKLVGSEAHYLIEYATVAAGTYNPGFNNPLGYPMLVASIAIQST